MHRFLLLCCGVVACGLTLTAQESKVHSLHIIPSGEAFGVIINSPLGLGVDATLTLPSTSGTLVTTTAGNLSLDNGGELRLYEPGGPNYTALVAGNLTADITYTLPITAPTTGQVLQAGATPTNLEWATIVSPVPAYNITTANVTSNSAAWSNGVSVAVAANKTYLVEVRATFVPIASQGNPDAQFRFAVPTGATLAGGYSTATSTGGDAIADYLGDATVATTLTAGGIVNSSVNEEHTLFFSGTLTVSGTAGNVTLEFTNSDGTDSTVLRAGAIIKVTPL